MSTRDLTIIGVVITAIALLIAVVVLVLRGSNGANGNETNVNVQTPVETDGGDADANVDVQAGGGDAETTVNTTTNVTVSTPGEEQQEEIGPDTEQSQAQGGAPAAGADTSAQQQEEADQQQQQQEDGENEPPTPEPPNLDGIEDGARICASPECPEQYVVKIVGDQRFKRLLLSYDVVTFYGQFDNTRPLCVPQDTLDAFTTSCFVWFNDGGSRTYYHFDARPGTDDGVKRRINATAAELRNAGIASAAFEVNERELAYFADRGSAALAEAVRLPCIG